MEVKWWVTGPRKGVGGGGTWLRLALLVFLLAPGSQTSGYSRREKRENGEDWIFSNHPPPSRTYTQPHTRSSNHIPTHSDTHTPTYTHSSYYSPTYSNGRSPTYTHPSQNPTYRNTHLSTYSSSHYPSDSLASSYYALSTNHSLSHPTTHHHRHYRDQNNHKVRHHRELRRMRKRNLENQYEPKFDHTQYQETVPENLEVHSSILQVHATDDDLDMNGLIRYSVSDPETFSIDEGGVLYNVKPLDYEHTNGEYLLYVYAEDQGVLRSSRKKAAVPVYLRVRDTREPPVFDQKAYSFSASEFAEAGTYVGTVVARDSDQDFDRYELQSTTTFKVDPKTGIITLGLTGFGAEWEYVFEAVAYDATNQSSKVNVTVDKIDENTNKPVFQLCEDVTVKENQPSSTAVVVVRATDEDHGVNGQVSYYLLNTFDSFDIVPQVDSGQIVTTRELDRDGKDREFFLTVIAKDGAPPSESLQEACTLKVMVEDVNDNAPIFDQAVYTQKIATDHSTDVAVLRVTGTDMDTGQNAVLQYSLQGDTGDLGYFEVDENTGIIKLLQSLDSSMADNNKIFKLDAVATDKGSPPLQGTAEVNIEVVSSGSLPPSIMSQTPTDPIIPENADENTDVVTLCAKSNVVDDPEVFFTLLTGNTVESNAEGTFAKRDLEANDPACPDDTRGVVIFVAIRNLDYEAVTAYQLILRVLNNEGALENVQINVEIQDVNDNPPLLRPFDGGAIVENSPSTLITTIEAIDKDVSEEFRQLVFSFDKTASADVKSKFEVRSDGQLWTIVSLDREDVDRYMVPIRVTDGMATHSRMNIYWITVQDINDVPPEFDKENGVYEVQVNENMEVNSKTGIYLNVIDPDIVNHNDFQIVSGNEKHKFRIDSTTGEVYINEALDYDDPVNDRNFTMLVRLSDGRNDMAETNILIAVINVNDQQPVFEKTNYNFSVTENIDCNKVFGQVAATDPDLPSNVDQNIRYYLAPNELTNFTIGETSGELAIVGCLDREAANRGIMTLYPLANDEGGAGIDADPTTVQVNILDINDNHPYIQTPEHSYTMFMENTDPSTVQAVTILLSDWDTAEHGCPCTLAFQPDTDPDILAKFNVVKAEGDSRYEIRPLVMLDREAQKFYTIPFTTRDKEDVNGVRYLTVEIGDVNDSPMSDGSSSIQVYNYQGQFPEMVIGSVYVTDADDYDIEYKTFQLLPSDDHQVETYFSVDTNNGNITMKKGTPEGTYTLKVKVVDKYRNETATGSVEVLVVDLTEEAVMQSGSFRVEGYSAQQVLQQQGNAVSGTSLYERLKVEIGKIHGIKAQNVDIFTLTDAKGGNAVDIRYNCHSSPYYTAPRLDGLMLTNRNKLMETLGVNISIVNLNECLYESLTDCGTSSCQQFLRPNLTSPLVVASDTTTMVGVDITPEYNCVCGALEPLPSACYPGFCYNGGKCVQENSTLVCQCPDSKDYGPRCELKSARFERGYAWYQAPKVCNNSTLFISFEPSHGDGILLYSGPTVVKPWNDYPGDFIYVILNNWLLQVFIDMGTGTLSMDMQLERNNRRTFDCTITWNEQAVTLEVAKCLDSESAETPTECRQSVKPPGTTPSHLLNLAAPLQLGGVAAMPSISELANSYEWTITPPYMMSFYGCIQELRHNDYLYDLNSTDYDKKTYKPCDAPSPAQVIMGQQSIVIIVVSLLCLLLLVLLILCLARRNQKAVSYPDLDGIVKETIGGSDLEGFGEKDMTQYDLKLLRVGPNGYLFSDTLDEGLSFTNPVMHDAFQGDSTPSTLRVDDGPRVGVAEDERQKRKAPLAPMSEDLSIGDFINDNIKKVDKDPTDFDDVRHYCYEGDEMSVASLSSIDSGGSTDSDATFDYKNDWGPRFGKLNEIYKRGSDEETESEYEFPNIPKQRKRASLPPPVREPRSPTSTTTTSQSPQVELGPGPGPELPQLDPSLLGEQKGPSATTFKPVSEFSEVEEGEESWC